MYTSNHTIANLPNIECLKDGPLFRATVKHLESRTATLKSQLKRIIKAASASLEARKIFEKADQELMESLKEIDCVDSLTTYFLDDAWSKIAKERQKLDVALFSEFIEPLKTIYEQDVKFADSMKRKFEEESKVYDHALAKYLKKRKQVNEEKQEARKLKYDLARFDYLSYLVDLHGGRKEHSILVCITGYAVRELNQFESVSEKISGTKSNLDLLSVLMSENSQEFSSRMNERTKKRIEMESALAMKVSDKNKRSSLPDSANSACSATLSSTETESVPEDKFKGIRDLERRQAKGDILNRKKEGLLFATSKASKISGFEGKAHAQSWNKYWYVLSGGLLYEYANWKNQFEQHSVPIDLRLATVREARNAERRFCFEIITPHLKRTYQATTQEEADQWISTIQNSIESVLNGTSSSANFKVLTIPAKKKYHGHPLRSLSAMLKSMAVPDKQSAEALARIGIQPTSTQPSTPSHQTVLPKPAVEDAVSCKKLINMLRANESNRVCADCDTKDPDWCSLNLGVLLCIGCSGIHRSLGTHVSKIRSLKLDRACYTPEIIQFLQNMGNARSNTIRDPRFPRPLANTREAKMAYVKAKYVDNAFTDKSLAVYQWLLEAMKDGDIQRAIYLLELLQATETMIESSGLNLLG